MGETCLASQAHALHVDGTDLAGQALRRQARARGAERVGHGTVGARDAIELVHLLDGVGLLKVEAAHIALEALLGQVGAHGTLHHEHVRTQPLRNSRHGGCPFLSSSAASGGVVSYSAGPAGSSTYTGSLSSV